MNQQYLVVCLDEDELVLASRTVFYSKIHAEEYCRSIPACRKPQIVLCQFKIIENNGSLRPSYEDSFKT